MPLRARSLLIAAALAVGGCATAAPAASPPVDPSGPKPFTVPPSAPPPSAGPTAPGPITYPAHGQRKWSVAPGQTGPADGTGGHLLNYRVLVERDIAGLTPSDFAGAVRDTLAAPGGWTTDRKWRFRRVGPGQAYDFTLYLATPDTKDTLCAGSPDGYTSCRNGDSVVLNVARWVKGVPRYGASLATYRQYMVNHEVGHRLGFGHELCSGAGRPAPVMQQQTLGLHGCTANPWPYRSGHLYAGRSGQYDDHVPARDTGSR